MSRDLSTAMQTVTTDSVVRPFFLVTLDFPTGSINFWSGGGNLVHGQTTYIGAGDLLSVSSFEEKTDLAAVGAAITLNGIKTSLVQKARDENYQGRAASIKLGAFDTTGNIIADPVTMFSGFMDVMVINEGAEYSEITVTLENKLLQLERSKERRYTDGDQRLDYPDDDGFEFVAALQDYEIVWGRAD